MSNFNARIKLKRDTAVNWTVNNPVLLNGEIILIDTDSGELRAKVGDGTKTYTQLPFTDEILRNLITNKQNKLIGTQGQIVGFDEDGNAIAQNDKSNTAVQLDYANMKSLHGLGITDLNNVTEPGTYVGMSNGTTYPEISNIPNKEIATAFYLEVRHFVGPSSTDFEGYAMIIQNIYSMAPVDLAPSCGYVRYGIISSESEISWSSWSYFAMPFITGTSGQVVGFDSQGKPVAQEAPSGLPEGGTDGKILGYSSSRPQWIDAPKTTSFVIQAEAPSDTSLLWINNTEHTLNYWDGSAWVKTVGVWG